MKTVTKNFKKKFGCCNQTGNILDRDLCKKKNVKKMKKGTFFFRINQLHKKLTDLTPSLV